MKNDGIPKIFPIKNSSACVFKWSWNTFRVITGGVSSCHRVKNEYLTSENFKEKFHNTPEVLNDRKLMLQGLWPKNRGCEYCKNIEDAGGISDRLYHNGIEGLTPIDFNQTEYVSPSISEIYIDNTCDLACVYCQPLYSSKINQEYKQFGSFSWNTHKIPIEKNKENNLFSKYIEWLTDNSSNLIRLSILGGEPLIQKDFWTLVELLKTVGHKNLELAINTNLNCDQQTIERLVEKAKELTVNKNIKFLYVSGSLDCWGDQAKFVRYGLSLENWERNFQYLMKHKWIKLAVHQVITSLTIKTANELQKRIAEYKKVNPKIIQEYHLPDGGSEKVFHPEIFGKSFFAKQLEQLVKEFPITSEWDKFSRQRLEGVLKLMNNAEPDHSRLTLFKETLDAIDFRHNTDWKKLWPEINDYFNLNNI